MPPLASLPSWTPSHSEMVCALLHDAARCRRASAPKISFWCSLPRHGAGPVPPASCAHTQRGHPWGHPCHLPNLPVPPCALQGTRRRAAGGPVGLAVASRTSDTGTAGGHTCHKLGIHPQHMQAAHRAPQNSGHRHQSCPCLAASCSSCQVLGELGAREMPRYHEGWLRRGAQPFPANPRSERQLSGNYCLIIDPTQTHRG